MQKIYITHTNVMNRNTAQLVFLHFSSFPPAFLTTSFCNTFFVEEKRAAFTQSSLWLLSSQCSTAVSFFSIWFITAWKDCDQSEVRLGIYVRIWDFILTKHRSWTVDLYTWRSIYRRLPINGWIFFKDLRYKCLPLRKEAVVLMNLQQF